MSQRRVCDQCGRAAPLHDLTWLRIEWDIDVAGIHPREADFCSEACALAYLTHLLSTVRAVTERP